MSYVIDAAGKVHEKQLAAATKSQDLFVKVIEKVAGLREKAPQAPEAPEALKGVTEPIQKVTAPVTKVFGGRAEVTEYVNASTRDWFNAQQAFQRQVMDALIPQGSGPKAKSSTRKTASKKA